jgi:hypothetical protein
MLVIDKNYISATDKMKFLLIVLTCSMTHPFTYLHGEGCYASATFVTDVKLNVVLRLHTSAGPA